MTPSPTKELMADTPTISRRPREEFAEKVSNTNFISLPTPLTTLSFRRVHKSAICLFLNGLPACFINRKRKKKNWKCALYSWHGIKKNINISRRGFCSPHFVYLCKVQMFGLLDTYSIHIIHVDILYIVALCGNIFSLEFDRVALSNHMSPLTNRRPKT